jgi:uncharacterized protein YecT (DUF1311 family)
MKSKSWGCKFAGFCILICPVALLAQSRAKTADAGSVFDAKQTAMQKAGSDALKREKARSRADLCSDAGAADGNAGISVCLVKEEKTTEENYTAYIRAIGGLLRLSAPDDRGESVRVQSGRLPFDNAEGAWRTYREQSCRSMATQWDGGDQAQVAYPDCILKLTWNHMNELAGLYSDLWH